MADTKPGKSKGKRLVKNPETFRERALKASESESKPTRTSNARQTGRKVTRLLTAPFIYLGRFRVFRLIGRILLPTYVRNSWQELKKVTWPNWRQSRQLTFAVLVFAIIFGAVVAVVDYGLDKVFRNILLK